MFLSRKLDVLCLSDILDNNTSLVPIILLKKLLVNLNYLRLIEVIQTGWLVRSWFEPWCPSTLKFITYCMWKVNKKWEIVLEEYLIWKGKVNHAKMIIPRGSWNVSVKIFGGDIIPVVYPLVCSIFCHISTPNGVNDPKYILS